ncbi:MAG: metal-dependent hydrolase [Candidatus Aenigmarchaeota archaeon]|nr:metal-dependent hydrolase [Candidatus Aenigmarchaeota archaeon]
MPLAVTHVLSSIILVDLYRDYVAKHKKYFTIYTIFLAGFFGLLPDIDIVLEMTAGLFNLNIPALLQHGGITHTPFFAFLFLIPAAILWKSKKHRQSAYFFVAAFAILLHISLDCLIGGGSYEGVMWLFPFSMQSWKIHVISYLNAPNITEALDAVILLGWLWHEEKKHKISDFI